MSREVFSDFLAGWIGGCAGVFAGHPFDTIKVRQQTMGKIGVLKGIHTIFKYEGAKGFYKGMEFPLLASGTLNSLFFGIYGNSLRLLSDNPNNSSLFNVFIAGCIGGIAQLIVACPVDLVKIKMQMQTGLSCRAWGKHFESSYNGPVACFKDLYLTGGIKNCFRGFYSMAVRDIPAFGLYMVLYETFYRNLSKLDTISSNSAIIISGGLAGALSWMSIVPFDVVKSRIQADNPENPQYKNFWDCVMKSYKNEGLIVFTRGFWMIILRAFPTNGAIFFAYISSLSMLRSL